MRAMMYTCGAVMLALGSLSGQSAAAQAAGGEISERAIQKPIKTLVGAIRYGKDDLAAQQLDFEAMGSALLGKSSEKLSAAERQTFQRLLTALLRKISFTKGRELFAYLDAVVYSPATAQDGKMHCKSTIVVHRELKKQELVIEWVVRKSGAAFLVVDMIIGGHSTLDAMRDEQVLPLLSQGSAPALLKAMQDKLGQTP